MTSPPTSDWLEHGNTAYWFFGIALLGFFVMFSPPLPKRETVRAKSKTGRKSKKNTVTRKSRITEPKTPKTAKPKKVKKKNQYEPPPLSPAQQREADRRFFDRNKINHADEMPL